MDLTLIVDTRTRPLLKPLTYTMLRTAARQCGDIFSASRLAASHQLATVTIHAVGHRHLTRVAHTDHTGDGNLAMQVLLRALGAIAETAPEVVPAVRTGNEVDGDLPTTDSLAVVRSLLLAESEAIPGLSRVVLFLSSFVAYPELFSGLAHLTVATLPYNLRCVIVDAEAVQVTRATLGPSGTLHCCSPDPIDIRAALQATLVHDLLFTAIPSLAHAPRPLSTAAPLSSFCNVPSALQVTRPGVGAGVSVRVRLGSALTLACVAERPYLCPLLRCATADAFIGTAPERPSRVLLADGRVADSGFEVTRASDKDTATVLQLEAVVPLAETLAEGFDNSWLMLAAAAADAATSTTDAMGSFRAAFEVFGTDALVLRCVSGDVRLAAPHRMAVQSSSYVATFLSSALLLLRQVIPTELVRVLPPPPTTAQMQPPRHLVDSLLLVKEHVKARRNRPEFSLDAVLESGIALLASQLRVDDEYVLQLTRRSR